MVVVALLLIAATAANWLLLRYYSADEDFTRAEDVVRSDERFRAKFGGDVNLYPARRTVVNRLPPQRSYVELGFRVIEEGGKTGGGYITVKLYEMRGVGKAEYELTVH